MDQPSGPFPEMKQGFNVFVGVNEALMFPQRVYGCVLGTQGKRSFGSMAVIGLLLYVPLMLWICPPTKGGQYLMWYWTGMFWMLLVHFVVRFWRLRHGELIHSFYIGDPWVSLVFRRVDLTTARTINGCLCVLLGWALMRVCETLGWCIFVSAVADAISMAMIAQRERRIGDGGVDAYLESSIFNGQVQQRLGERR